jgi:hypothetical protein
MKKNYIEQILEPEHLPTEEILRNRMKLILWMHLNISKMFFLTAHQCCRIRDSCSPKTDLTNRAALLRPVGYLCSDALRFFTIKDSIALAG